MAARPSETEATQPLLSLENIDKSFGDQSVFRGMSLRVDEGEVLAIIGESGTGKSTCLKLMTRLLEADAGIVRFRGRDLAGLDATALAEVRRRMMYVFQNDALFDSLDILHNVGYSLYEHTTASEAEIRVRVLECLTMVDLPETILPLRPANLSGGMRKRVGLARAIAARPEVILYDDPTGGLDPQNVTRIGTLIGELRKTLHITSVVVTHEIPMAFALADRIAVAYEGGFPYVGTPDELRVLASSVDEVRALIDEPLRIAALLGRE